MFVQSALGACAFSLSLPPYQIFLPTTGDICLSKDAARLCRPATCAGARAGAGFALSALGALRYRARERVCVRAQSTHASCLIQVV